MVRQRASTVLRRTREAVGLLLRRWFELLFGDGVEGGVGACAYGRGSGHVFQQSDLADDCACGTDGEQHRTLAGRLDDLDLTGLDDICPVALVAFVEEIFAGGKIDDFGQFK